MKIITYLFLLISINCYSQITFEKRIELLNIEFGGQVLEVKGGYLVSGYSKSKNNIDFDIVLAKLDSIGNTKWIKYLGEQNKDEYPAYINHSTDNGFLICGTQDFSKTIVYKINQNGDSIWRTVLHENKYDEYGKSIIQLNDTTIICVGGNGIESAIYKLDTFGILKDTIFLDSVAISEICKYSNAEFAMVGTEVLGDFNTDISFLIIDNNLNIKIEKQYGGLGLDKGRSITTDKNGDLYILGEYDYQIMDYGLGILTLKINSNGDTIWQNTLNWVLEPKHICTDSNLNCYFSSCITNDELFGLVKIDSIGTYSWYKDFRGLTEFGNNFSLTNDSGFIFVGYESQDLKVLKLNNNAEIITEIKSIVKSDNIIKIYPNPVKDHFKVYCPESINIKRLRIFDITGKIVGYYNKTNTLIKLNAEKGIYIIELLDDLDKIYNFKVIKE